MGKYEEIINELGSVANVVAFEIECLKDICAQIEAQKNAEEPEWCAEMGIPTATEEERETQLSYLRGKRDEFISAIIDLTN